MRKRCFTARGIFASAIMLLGCSTAMADAPASEPFEARIIDMSLSTVLDVVSREFGVQFSGPRTDRARVIDLALIGDAEAVIDTVMRAANMDIFPFNGTIYYAPSAERAIRLIPLSDGITAEVARNALADAGLVFEDFSISEVAGGTALAMSGPVQYLALSEGVINAVAAAPDEELQLVRVRRGGVIETGETEVSAVNPDSTE